MASLHSVYDFLMSFFIIMIFDEHKSSTGAARRRRLVLPSSSLAESAIASITVDMKTNPVPAIAFSLNALSQQPANDQTSHQHTLSINVNASVVAFSAIRSQPAAQTNVGKGWKTVSNELAPLALRFAFWLKITMDSKCCTGEEPGRVTQEVGMHLAPRNSYCPVMSTFGALQGWATRTPWLLLPSQYTQNCVCNCS